MLLAVLALGGLTASAQKGEHSVGAHLEYGTEVSNVGFGAKYRYNVLEALRLEGAFDYFLKKDGVSAWDINITAHYLFPVGKGFKVYPLAGITYSRWKAGSITDDIGVDWGGAWDSDNDPGYPFAAHPKSSGWDIPDDIDVDMPSVERFGVNLGAGVDYDINEHWGLNFEAKYQLISDFGQAVFALGAVYKF